MSSRFAGRKGSLLPGLAVGMALTALVALLQALGALDRPEMAAYDWRLRLQGGRAPSPDILLVTVDQRSAAELGRKISQWPRSLYARAVANLAEAGAELVVLDLDLSGPGTVEPGEDEALERAIEDAGNVVLARFVSGGRQVPPREGFRRGAVGEGFINLLPDPDGVLRGLPLVGLETDESGAATPRLALALETARLALDPEGARILDLGTPDRVSLGDLLIPDPGGRMLIDFAGPPGTFERISFVEVLRGGLDPARVKGRIVLVGNTHPAFHDDWLTPFSAPRPLPEGLPEGATAGTLAVGMAGVEVHANAIQTVMGRSFVRTFSLPAALLALLLAGAASSLLLVVPARFPGRTLALFLLLAGGVAAAGPPLFAWRRVMLPLFPLELVIALCFVGGVAWQRVLALREKAFVTSTFGRYVSYQVVDRILREPELIRLGGEKKTLTVLFADVRGFTTLAERMDPAEVVRTLNELHTAMTRVVFDHGGVLDKYLGDGLMAFFGAPVEAEDHAARGCRAALAMMEALDLLRGKWEGEGRPALAIGVGLNSGPMILGNLGSEMRLDYTVMGDSVNLAARLEPLNKRYGTRILAGSGTRESAGEGFFFRELGRVRVKGRSEPASVHELLPGEGAGRPSWLSRWGEGLAAYRARDFQEAAGRFCEVLELRPGDGPAGLYLKRCEDLAVSPPPREWDGVDEAG